MPAPIPVHAQFNDEQKQQVREWHRAGKTQAQIADLLSVPRRTVMKLCQHLELGRTVREAAKLATAPDDPELVQQIRTLRPTHSLPQLVTITGIPLATLDRICKRNGVEKPVDYAQQQSERMLRVWTPEKREDTRQKARARVTPELRELLRQSSRKLWRGHVYRRVQADHRAKQSWAVSSIQTHLYGILDDLDVAYFREWQDRPNDPETVVGPYNFDCAVPRPGKPTLLIECHGDYWHSLGKTIVKDKQKQSYIVNNFADRYELKCIWEHEFKCRGKVSELLKYWLGITSLELVDFEFSDLVIRTVDVKAANSLLEKYHYLSGCGRGGVSYGVFLADKLIAVCAFSSLVRQNLPYDRGLTKELSRFCVHPRYQKKNLGSWIIGRCLKLLPAHIGTVVSYCDTTFNHDGALYKACNFELDGVVRPDYWYVNENKWVMSKKSLYQHATKMSMKEADFAAQHGYCKVYGSEKLRFIYRR